jgi:arylsulfatase A-like enzyme
MHRISLNAFLWSWMTAISLLGTTVGAAENERPHIIVILADDMGWGDLGCYGGKVAPTPNIDRLAAEGTRFTQYYAAAPICSPSRAGLLTGQHPGRWRITSFLQTRQGNRGCEQADFLDPKAPTLPRTLRTAGYATAHVGKWHLGGGRDVLEAPKFAAYGYDEGVGTYESPEPHPDITATNWIWSAHDRVKRWDRTAFFVDRTLDFLKRQKATQPCFVNLWLDDPHTPWVPGPDAPKRDTQENLRAVLIENDRQIGRLMEGLRELGIDRETLIIFASDNGPLPTFNGKRNVGLRASKLSLYEGGIRMPFLVRWPGKVQAGRVDTETVVSAPDIFPTLAAIGGAESGVQFDGQDMSAALRGKTSPDRKAPLFWEYGRNEQWFRYPRAPGDRSPNVAVRGGRWKLLVNADGQGAELYDVVSDLGERNNVIAAQPEIAQRLTTQALEWRKSLPDGSQERAESAVQRPNIVVFLTDDQDQLDTTVYSGRKVRTPNMERLAAAGMTLTHAFVASPSCAPSRAALLTGLMPARNGAEDNHARPRKELKKWPAYFQELGYEVVSFGKVAHYGHGKEYGFDHAAYEGFQDHRGIEAAVNFLAKRDLNSSKPLCIFVGTHWPHRPWPRSPGEYDPAKVDVPPTHADTPVTRAFRARYYNAVTKADEYLGNIHDAARKHLGEKTIFVFSSDHGAQWPFGKWNLYDAGIRVPLIVCWPGVIKPGTRSAAMVSWVDLLPTLLEAGGGTPPENGLRDGQIDGRSFLGVLRGESDQHRDRIFASHSGDREMNVYPMRSVRTVGWKYIWNLHPEFQYTTHVDRAQDEDEVGYWRSWERAAADGDAHAAKLVQRYRQRPANELYDLSNDPFEQRNLASEPAHSARIKSLREELETWMRQQGDQRKVFNKPILLHPSETD